HRVPARARWCRPCFLACFAFLTATHFLAPVLLSFPDLWYNETVIVNGALRRGGRTSACTASFGFAHPGAPGAVHSFVKATGGAVFLLPAQRQRGCPAPGCLWQVTCLFSTVREGHHVSLLCSGRTVQYADRRQYAIGPACHPCASNLLFYPGRRAPAAPSPDAERARRRP